MKKHGILICFLLIFLFFSCGQKDCCGVNEINYISFEIDGQSWVSNNAYANVLSLGNFFSVEISGTNQNSENFTLKVSNTTPLQTGALVISSNLNNFLIYAPTGNINGAGTYRSNFCALVSGDVNIIYFDTFYISGTFSGTVCLANGQSKQIRNGRFTQVAYQ